MAHSACSRQTFKWSEKQFTLTELAEDYKDLLPFPVLITTSFLSREAADWSVSKNEVYWAHTAVEHQWIVMKDQEGNHFKVPLCYDAMVIPIMADGTEGGAFPFHKVRERGGYRTIRFVESRRQLITDDSCERTSCCFGEMAVVDVCNESFVVLHPLRMECLVEEFGQQAPCSSHLPHKDVIAPSFKMLPAAVPVQVSLGVALDRAPDVIYFHTMAEFKMLADSYSHNYREHLRQTSAICLETTLRNDDRYEYLDMTECTGTGQCTTDNLTELVSRDREEPIALSTALDPRKRLKDLVRFYNTGNAGETDICLSSLKSEGYLEPLTWLVINTDASKIPANQEADNEYKGCRHHVDVPVDDGGEVKGVSGLRRRFEDAIKWEKENRATSNCHRPPTTTKQLKEKVITIEAKLSLTRSAAPKYPAPNQAKRNVPEVHSAALGYVDSRGNAGNEVAIPELVGVSARRHSEGRLQPKGEGRRPSDVRCVGNFSDVPVDVSALGVDELMKCLRHLDMSEHVPAMRDCLVDGRLLLCLDEQQLVDNFGFSAINATKLMQFAKRGW